VSKLLNFGVVATQSVGPASGIAIGSIILTPAAAIGTLSISDATGVLLTLSAPANGSSITHVFADDMGIITTGQCTITTTGAAISVTLELM
jgi:hypothetical protein